MIKKITLNWLQEKKACEEAVEAFKAQTETDPIKIIKKLIKNQKLDWANWLVVRLMVYKQYVSYAAYAAELVLPIFEKKYPDDKRPRQAIEAAKKCIQSPSKKNKESAWSAAESAARSAARSAAWSAESAARSAARSAAWSAESAARKMKIKIIKFGVELLTRKPLNIVMIGGCIGKTNVGLLKKVIVSCTKAMMNPLRLRCF